MEETERARMARQSEWEFSDFGRTTDPSSSGYDLETVRLRGTYPDTRVEVIFHVFFRPGQRSGFSYPIWDAKASRRSGQPIVPDYIRHGLISVQEEIASDIPMAPDPDPEGITWIGKQPVTLGEAAARFPVELLVPAEPPTDHLICHYQRHHRRGTRIGVRLRYVEADGTPRLWIWQWAGWWPDWVRRLAAVPPDAVPDPRLRLVYYPESSRETAIPLEHRRTLLLAGPADGSCDWTTSRTVRTVRPSPGALDGRGEVAYHLGIELTQLGEPDRARQAFEIAATAGPADFTKRATDRLAELGAPPNPAGSSA